jgi:hypothetical protein
VKAWVLSVMFLPLLLFSGEAMPQSATKQAFSADPKIAGVTGAYALDAVDHAKAHFGVILDWSDGSIAKVETILARLHADYKSKAQIPDDAIAMIAKGYGSYIGEVYRRNHGGEWGIMTLDGLDFPAVKARSGTAFWPIGRVTNRIKNGSGDNVAFYYRRLLAK